jgi:hypothetical protein
VFLFGSIQYFNLIYFIEKLFLLVARVFRELKLVAQNLLFSNNNMQTTEKKTLKRTP